MKEGAKGRREGRWGGEGGQMGRRGGADGEGREGRGGILFLTLFSSVFKRESRELDSFLGPRVGSGTGILLPFTTGVGLLLATVSECFPFSERSAPPPMRTMVGW